MSREIHVEIEELRHDMVYTKTTITETEVVEVKYMSRDESVQKSRDSMNKSGCGGLALALIALGSSVYAGYNIIEGVQSRNLEEIKSGVF